MASRRIETVRARTLALAYPHGQPILGQTVLPKGRKLDQQVDLVEKHGGEPLLETREHVFAKVRRGADRTEVTLQELLQRAEPVLSDAR